MDTKWWQKLTWPGELKVIYLGVPQFCTILTPKGLKISLLCKNLWKHSFIRSSMKIRSTMDFPINSPLLAPYFLKGAGQKTPKTIGLFAMSLGIISKISKRSHKFNSLSKIMKVRRHQWQRWQQGDTIMTEMSFCSCVKCRSHCLFPAITCLTRRRFKKPYVAHSTGI